MALAEVGKMRKKGPKAVELESAKRYISGLYPARLETNESVAAAIAETRLYGLGDDWVSRYRERVKAVTRKQALEAARTWLPESDPAFVIVGNAEKVKSQLKGLGTIDVRPVSELE